jgi:hypothetical protein
LKFVREQFFMAATAQNNQAASQVPQPANDVTGSRYFIGKGRSPSTQLQSSIPQNLTNDAEFFNTHASCHCLRQGTGTFPLT